MTSLDLTDAKAFAISHGNNSWPVGLTLDGFTFSVVEGDQTVNAKTEEEWLLQNSHFPPAL
jgi:hypothetical protein